MKRLRLVSIVTILHLLVTCLAVPSQSSSSNLELDSQSNQTYPPTASASVNQSNLTIPTRFYVINTPIAIDFYSYPAMKSMPRQDILMCVVEGLSKIFGNLSTDAAPRLSNFYYKDYAFIHIQDYNPIPGREHTYGDMAATLRGVAEYVTEYGEYKTLEFQVWSLAASGEVHIGSGVVGPMEMEAAVTMSSMMTAGAMATPSVDTL